jgi:DNA topoisomerase-6 subunit B
VKLDLIEEKYESISPADFFYRNKEIAGFDNSARATYTILRELVENSLDSCENNGIPPDVEIRMIKVDDTNGVLTSKMTENGELLKIRVIDNGGGVPQEHIPSAFGQVFYGSKYRLRQARGLFGLGGKMAILYGQITTNTTVEVASATLGSRFIYYYELMIDITRNKPLQLKRKILENTDDWHGTMISFSFIGDYYKAKNRIIEYLWQTSMILPYASIRFIDPDGVMYTFERKTENMPKKPHEILPHPHGVDVELLKRLITKSKGMTLKEFLIENFQRVGPKKAEKFLEYVGFQPDLRVEKLNQDMIVKLSAAMKNFSEFLPPDASGLSPIGEDLLKIGIKESTGAEFVHAVQRPPSSYEGHPFIVETAIAYGGKIQPAGEGEVNLYRFANKIPLLYDVYSDVSMKVIKRIDWNNYKIKIYNEPIAFFVHICSTKIPYKTVGKEYIAEQPEVAREIELGLRENARHLSAYLNKKRFEEINRTRLNVLSKYLKLIAKYSSELTGLPEPVLTETQIEEVAKQ